MSRRFILEWLGLSFAVGTVVPLLGFLATVLRMELIGDKPDASGAELATIEAVQIGFQLLVYVTGIVAFSLLILLFFKRK